jgi:ABC-type multidrug transport system ATPase subunit
MQNITPFLQVSSENPTKSFSFGEYLRRLPKSGAPDGAHPIVLKGVNLEVQEGEGLGLLGPNGAG